MINIIDFKTGSFVPLVTGERFPIGRVLTYEDRANPRQKFVVTSATSESLGQPVIGEAGQRSHCAPACIGRGGWSDTGHTLTASEIQAFITAASERQTREATERQHAAAKAAADRAQRTADALKTHPYLVQLAPGEYASAKAGAANLRRHLKHAFPGVKFSVRSDTFSGGDSIDIRWSMGPAVKEVEAISRQYQEGHFNGMEDIYENDNENIWPALFGGAKYVSAAREDDGAFNIVAGFLCDAFGIERPANNAFWTLRGEDDQRVCDTARGLLSATSFPIGAIITGVQHLPHGQRRSDISYGRTGLAEYYEITHTSPAAAAPAPAIATGPAQDLASADQPAVRIVENPTKNGLELHFPSKPPAFLLDSLKALGWRWSRHAGCWYHRAGNETRAFAENIANTWTPAA